MSASSQYTTSSQDEVRTFQYPTLTLGFELADDYDLFGIYALFRLSPIVAPVPSTQLVKASFRAWNFIEIAVSIIKFENRYKIMVLTS